MEDPIVLDSVLKIPLSRLTTAKLSDIQRALTLKLPDGGTFGFGKGGGVLRLYKVKHGQIHVPRNWPRARRFIQMNGIEDRRSPGFPIDLKWKGTPRKGQEEFWEVFLEALSEDGLGAIAPAAGGFGKTVVATKIISRINRTTLVVVHKEKLRDQFVTACETFLGITPGIIQGPNCDYKGHKVCIAMIQSLYQKDYGQDFYNYWGLVVTDETHRIAAPTFLDAIQKIPAKYRIGLTATPRRGDRMEDVFFWNIGDIGAVGRGQYLDCSVYVVEWSPTFPDSAYNFRGRPILGKLITALSKDESRTAMICRLVADATRKGRKSIILSDRVAHLEDFKDRLSRGFRAAGDSYTVEIFGSGSTKAKVAQRGRAEKADVTLSTWPMLSEGSDLPAKDTIILATPKADVEQAVGRIRRLFKGKKMPMVLDINDDIPMLKGFARKRLRFFQQPGLDKGPWAVKFYKPKIAT